MNNAHFITARSTALLLALAVMLVGCGEEMQESLRPTPAAVGKINQLVVIADQDTWTGPVGDTINFYYSGAFPILPQPEPLLDLNHFTPQQLEADALRKELRTYLFVANLDDKDSPATRLMMRDLGEERIRRAVEDDNFAPIAGRDKWASGQLLIYQFANSQKELIQLLKKNFPAILNEINKADAVKIEATIYLDGESRQLNEAVEQEMGIRLRVPNEYQRAPIDAEEGVIWLRKETPKASSNILIHKVNYTDQDQLSRDGLKAIRDELGKYISSASTNSFMQVNAEDLPLLIEETSLDGHYALEARGIWEMVNDFMGGSFISYLILDEEANELIFLDGFIYAPGEEKRNAMQYLDFILNTVEL